MTRKTLGMQLTMKSHFDDIDLLIKKHIDHEISNEVNQEIEDSIFFASNTICLAVLQDATEKLKKLLKKRNIEDIPFLKVDGEKFIEAHHLVDITPESEKYKYLLHSLLKAQIKINEAIIVHFGTLCKQSHSLDYLENRTAEIHRLLCDESILRKT